VTESDRVGLCFVCRHARRVPTPPITYWLCRLSSTDPRFDKYPRLPVRACPGFEPAPSARHDPPAAPPGASKDE
jgi:hypothetical protein